MMPRKLVLLASLASLTIAAPATAQMDHSNMPGMQMPAPKKPAAKKAPAPKATATRKPSAAAPKKPATAPAPAPSQAGPHAGHDMSQMPDAQAPAAADPHAGHTMATMPATEEPAAGPHAGHNMSTVPADQPKTEAPVAGHDMSNMSGMQMPGDQVMPAGHDMSNMAGQAQVGTNLPAGTGAAPPVPTEWAADRFYGQKDMTEGRHHGWRMHGGQNFYQVMANIAEYQVRDGRDGFNWDTEAWVGGDINRLWVKSEGEGEFGRGVESAEVQALYSRAIGPYFNLQGGVRYDFKPNPSRGYVAIGVEGLAPSFFDVEGFIFVSDKGDVLARAEGYYDQRLTQRLILQPRAELNFAAQDVPEGGIGAGLSDAEIGLRLRYDIRREFAPYVGVEYQRAFGQTADYRRADGDRAGGWNLVFGVRAWF